MDFKDGALAILVSMHEQYEALYKQCADTDTPGKKAWLEGLDTSEVDSAEMNEYFEPILEFAGSEEITPEEMLALLNLNLELTKKIREWLSGMYWGVKRSSEDNAPTPEKVQAALKLVNTAFETATNYVKLGVMTEDDIRQALPKNTQYRNVRSDKNGNPQTVFSYKPVGTVRVKKAGETAARGPRSNTKRYRLVYDGKVVVGSEGTLGEACRLKGVQVSTILAKAVELFGKDAWTNPRRYPEWNGKVEIDGHTFGLVEAP